MESNTYYGEFNKVRSLEAGHATQNLILQAACHRLGVCTITSYQLGSVYESLKLPREHRPIYLLPIGFPKRQIL
ncbi:MAG: nitroreductase family protein [Promethearchaeota archaeon]